MESLSYGVFELQCSSYSVRVIVFESQRVRIIESNYRGNLTEGVTEKSVRTFDASFTKMEIHLIFSSFPSENLLLLLLVFVIFLSETERHINGEISLAPSGFGVYIIAMPRARVLHDVLVGVVGEREDELSTLLHIVQK